MSGHILDRPVWSSLSTRHSQFAVGGELARRFSSDIGPLAASRDNHPQSLEALAELIPSTGSLVLLQADEVVLPPHVEVIRTQPGVQMLAERLALMPSGFDFQIERLSEADVPAMVALAVLTKPGPFESGTARLGDFWGIKENGTLLAMAGERMRQVGFSEVSGVCVHPITRGRNYARALSAMIARRIFDRGETPYLHSYANNMAAIRLYESLGFRQRCPVHVVAIARKS